MKIFLTGFFMLGLIASLNSIKDRKLSDIKVEEIPRKTKKIKKRKKHRKLKKKEKENDSLFDLNRDFIIDELGLNGRA